MEGLISGAECGPINPLAQVLKHTEGDRSLQQDRVAGPSSSRLQHLPATSSQGIQQGDQALASHFFGASARSTLGTPSFVLPPQLPPAELLRIQQNSTPSQLGTAWESSRAGPVAQHNGSAWASEFGGMSSGSMPLAQQNSVPLAAQNSTVSSMPMYGSMPMGMHSINFTGMASAPTFHQDLKGKGKAVLSPAEFEAAFAAAEASDVSRFTELDAESTGLENAFGAAKLEPVAAEGELKDETSRWEAELNDMMNKYRESGEYEYGKDLQEAWENGLGSFDNEMAQESLQFDDEGLPALGPYEFEKNNKFLGPTTSARSFLQDAKQLLENGGPLGEVALLLEAAIQRNEPGEGGYEAWLLLGETRSMDEREEAALRAFTEGVRIAQEHGGGGAGMISLAIAFTNEGYERASYSTLLRWLRAQYPSHTIPPDTLQSTTKSAWHSQPLVTDAFLALARNQHEAGEMDADVQIALGVLFYGRGEYEHARDCFQSALAARPDDFRLWNRYGSCLSNGNRPEESLAAYREALRLRPTYTRAVYNVAVACMNIGAHKEAAEHLLDALASQSDNGGTTSDQLWTTLQRAFSNMDRPDLADLAKSHPAVEIFRKEGFDFSRGGVQV